MPKNEESVKPIRVFHWVLLFVAFASAAVLVEWNTGDFRASVIPTKTAEPYDGTTTPVLKVPKWTALGSAEWDLAYDQIPADKMIPFPKYDPAVLKTPTEQLGWKSEQDLAIRNAKITFSVPYMGNYKLDGVEYAGSHLAVDIKVPSGTPVYAVGNGVVVKLSEQNTGFGKHIVIKHENFPSLNNASVKETLYSSYSHLGEVLITEGAVVSKGQLIGKSGETGTATTPHVHFQIDNSNAPWHPYWPFTYQEASAAGLSFFDAINEGLNQDKAIQTTVNPVLYTQKYLDASEVTESEPTPEPEEVAPEPESSNSLDENELPPVTIDSNSAETDTEETESPAETEEVAPEEPDTELASDPFFSDVDETDKAFKATSFLKEHDVIGGYPDGTFKPDAVVSRVEALKFILMGVNSNLLSSRSLPFKDTAASEWYSDYVATGYNKQIIDGYPDKSFRPANTVNRAEFLKMLLTAMDVELDSTITQDVYVDVPMNAWFAPYVQYSKDTNLVSISDKQFRPDDGMTRAEVAETIYRMIVLKVSGARKYSSGVTVSDSGVSAYFAS
ncbi:MAG TPA: S-layer homology domain-containing protein [Candidatus Gracilibacteria bacterium]|nr:S-layer homology domain-containing protein [Candidatus Gracilibacteria bacterium]